MSPPELKAALDKAQYALRGQAGSGDASGQGGVSRPLAHGGSNPPRNSPSSRHGGGRQSLAEEYRRMLAAKTNVPPEPETADDDEEPAWSGIIHNSGGESLGDISHGDESPVDRVLRLIPGTVVN